MISVLTMEYRPYNLLGPTLIGAIAAEIAGAQEACSRAIILRGVLRYFSAGADVALFRSRIEQGGKSQTAISGVDFLKFSSCCRSRSLQACTVSASASRGPTVCRLGGEHFTVATSLVGSRTFPSYLRAIWRADLADDPRFATAATRRAHSAELHRIVQTWILTFHDIGALDARLDEAKIALGEVRSLKKLSETEWAEYWGVVQEVSDRNGGTYRLPGRPWRFSDDQLASLGDPAFQGEHNRTVFGELGLSEGEIDSYIASGALVSPAVLTTVPRIAGTLAS